MPAEVVPISVVRDWARRKGLKVGNRGHLSNEVVRRFNNRHQAFVAVARNPWTNQPAEQQTEVS